MSSSSEKLVKHTLKTIAKEYELDYSELKNTAKKIIKTARNHDESIMGMMEELLDLGNAGSQEELDDFNIEVLKIYCRIKELDDSGSDKSIRKLVWENIEDEAESESESDESEYESEPESDIEEIVVEKAKVKKPSPEGYDPKGSSDEKPKKERRVKISESD